MDELLKDVKRFNLTDKPLFIKWYLKPITWLLSYPAILAHHTKIRKHNGVEKLKAPFLLLCNHNAFMDFKVATAVLFPHTPNNVIAIDGYLHREWLIKNIGAICKRKFTSDISLIRNMQDVFKHRKILALYPEARYSLCGTNAILPESLGKVIKYLKVPVATLICHGHHINSPYWALGDRKVHTAADYSLLLTAEQVKEMSVDEIFQKVNEAFSYDDFAWQKENGIKVDYPKRAEGLHKVLYQCPECGTEYCMESSGTVLRCTHCTKEWEMSELGELHARDGKENFTHIPDWYEWERSQVRKEIEEGRYFFEKEATIMALPNPDDFIQMGKCTLRHDADGFHVSGVFDEVPYEFSIEARGQYSVHIEYDYLHKYGDLVDLNTLNDTFYITPDGNGFSVTKISLATEELYKIYKEKDLGVNQKQE